MKPGFFGEADFLNFILISVGSTDIGKISPGSLNIFVISLYPGSFQPYKSFVT